MAKPSGDHIKLGGFVLRRIEISGKISTVNPRQSRAERTADFPGSNHHISDVRAYFRRRVATLMLQRRSFEQVLSPTPDRKEKLVS
jgi:hypothetical protein